MQFLIFGGAFGMSYSLENLNNKVIIMENMVKILKRSEMSNINGGHDGAAYNAGRATAKIFKAALGVIALIASRGRIR